MNWRLFGAHDGKPATVWPMDDLREHEPDNVKCWCRPRMDNGVLTHNWSRHETHEHGRRSS